MKYPPKQFPRHERKQQVIGQFNIWHGNGDTKPKTMGRVARALGLTPSNHFRDLLLEMAAEGSLIVDPPGEAGSHTVRYYSVSEDLSRRNVLRRTITVKKRGVAVGQLGLFS